MKQEQNNYCLCTVLQDILSEYNVFISQEDIAKKLTPTKKGFKINDNKIKEFMKEQGLNYKFYWYNETLFNEPESLLEEINKNQGFIGIKSHVYRLINFKDPTLFLYDPADKSLKEKDFHEVLKEFEKLDGGFGLIKKLN